MMLLICLHIMLGAPGTKVVVTPLDIRNKVSEKIVISGILQIETKGSHLLLRSPTMSFVLRVDEKGKVLEKIGNAQGPSPHPEPPVSVVALENELWVMTAHGKTIRYYNKGAFQKEIPLQPWYVDETYTSNIFAVNKKKDLIITPVSPRFRKLAIAYNGEGVKGPYLGEIQAINPADLSQNPALNDTLWTTDGNAVFCLWKHEPLVVKYSNDLQEVARFHLPLPDRPKKSKMRVPWFSDIKSHNGALLILRGMDGTLLQIDPENGDLLQDWRFHSQKIKRFHFRVFAMYGRDRVFLGHPYLKWGHDLWQATIVLQKKK